MELKNSESHGYKVIDHAIFNELTQPAVNKLIISKRTKRGCKAGQRHKRKRPDYKCTRKAVLTYKTDKSGITHNDAKLPSLLYTNCRSLTEWKLAELSVLSEIHQPQIICLTETWLSEAKEKSRQLEGYQHFYCHRKNRIGGGVAILTTESLPTTLLSSYTTPTFSAIWTISKIENYDDMVTGCIYHPPNAEIDDTLEYIGNVLSDISKSHPFAKFMIAGDFNHLPVESLLSQLDVLSLVNFNTREQAKLDLVLTNIAEYKPAEELSPIANNDHCCILVKGNIAKKAPRYIKTTRRIITPVRKARVLCDLAKQDWNAVLSSPDPDSKTEALHGIVTNILDDHCPFRTRKVRRDRPGWMSTSLQKLINARDKARKNKCKSFKVIRALTQRRIRSAKRSWVNTQLNSNQNTKQWWSTLRSVTQPPKTPSSDIQNVEGSTMTPNTFCDRLNKYYISVGGDPKPLSKTSVPEISASAPLQHLSLGEIKQLLSKLDITKATSSEDFPTWLSLEGREDICVPLCDIINNMLSTARFPNKWKRAQVNPAAKVSCPSKFKDYRPISLLYHLGKLAEEVVINKMRKRLEEIIEPSQFAYQRNVGTVAALIKLLDDFSAQLDKPDVKFIQSAALDFSKAFDRLQPSILIQKMTQYGFNSNITALVQDFLSDRKQCVKFGDCYSDYLSVRVGAPQGTKLGPILWLIYSNDLEVDGYDHIKFADDTTLYTAVKDHTSQSAIVPAIASTESWSMNNNMLLNTDKTEIMNTSLSHRHSYDDKVESNGILLTPGLHTKFLGIFIDNKLSFNVHVDNIVSKCNSRLFLMRKLRTIGLSNDGLKIFYSSNIRSVVSYAAPAWYTLLSNHNRERLERIQRSATRVIHPDLCYEERLLQLLLPKLNDFMFRLSYSHFDKILANDTHPLHDRLIFNTNSRTSSRARSTFRPQRCRTEKRLNSFFPFFMTYYDNGFIYKD